MAAGVLQGDVFDVLPTLEPGSVDCVVTSPPYWKLRSYLPKDHLLKPRELGSEPTPAAYVESMVRVFRLVRDVMAPHATCWLNVGDTYSGGAGNQNGLSGSGLKRNVKSESARVKCRTENKVARGEPTPTRNPAVDAGNLCLIPQRLALALQADGWFVRSVVVWHKPAPIPSSVSGWAWRRCRVKTGERTRHCPKQIVGESDGVYHKGIGTSTLGYPGWREDQASGGLQGAQWSDCPGCRKCDPHGGYVLRRGSWRPTSAWEPVLLLAKSPRYYADGIAVQQPAASATVSRNEYTRVLDDPDEAYAVKHDHETLTTTANLRDVWTIAAEPLKEKHFASFPTELVHRCLRAGTSARGYCPHCGAPWARVVESADTGRTQKMADGWDTGPGGHGSIHRNGREQGRPGQPVMESRTLDWRPTCPCPPHEPRPGRVLDPFAGSGRVGIESLRLGLDFTGIELNEAYVTMANRLLRNESPLFAGV